MPIVRCHAGIRTSVIEFAASAEQAPDVVVAYNGVARFFMPIGKHCQEPGGDGHPQSAGAIKELSYHVASQKLNSHEIYEGGH